MKLLFITNDPILAQYAEMCGINRIMVDLEIMGKEQRQGHLDTVISRHSMGDVVNLRSRLSISTLMVRINPLHSKSQDEINEVIECGADRLMLPMFRSEDEVAQIIDMIAGRVPLTLLLETGAALARLSRIVTVPGIDDVHIGLNDLHLDLKLDFMFELFPSGFLDFAANILHNSGIPFGIGGIAKLGEGQVSANLIISEHQRLGSTRVILSRGFYSPGHDKIEVFGDEVNNLRRYLLKPIKTISLEENRKILNTVVNDLATKIIKKRCNY